MSKRKLTMQQAESDADEVDRILGRVEERKDISTAEITFREGDPVKVISAVEFLRALVSILAIRIRPFECHFASS